MCKLKWKLRKIYKCLIMGQHRILYNRRGVLEDPSQLWNKIYFKTLIDKKLNKWYVQTLNMKYTCFQKQTFANRWKKKSLLEGKETILLDFLFPARTYKLQMQDTLNAPNNVFFYYDTSFIVSHNLTSISIFFQSIDYFHYN